MLEVNIQAYIQKKFDEIDQIHEVRLAKEQKRVENQVSSNYSKLNFRYAKDLVSENQKLKFMFRNGMQRVVEIVEKLHDEDDIRYQREKPLVLSYKDIEAKCVTKRKKVEKSRMAKSFRKKKQGPDLMKQKEKQIFVEDEPDLQYNIRHSNAVFS